MNKYIELSNRYDDDKNSITSLKYFSVARSCFTMANKYFLSFLFIQLHLFEIIGIMQMESTRKELDLTKLIEFPYEQKCLQIVLKANLQPRLSLVGLDNVSVHIRSHISLKFRNISTEEEGQCQTFLIFAESIEIVKQIFIPDQSNGKQFFPFTKIYFHFDNRLNYTTNPETMSLAREFLIENALFGYVFDDEESVLIIRDLLTNDVKTSIASYTPQDLLHPTVDTNFVKDNFRVSLFNCVPYTIYPEHADEQTYS